MCRKWSLLRPFGGACFWWQVPWQRHVELVAVAAVARDDVLQRPAVGRGHAAEDQQRGVERGVEPAGGRRVGGSRPTASARRCRWRGRRLVRKISYSEPPRSWRSSPGRRSRGYQPFSSAIGWPSARRTRSIRQATPSAPRSSALATSIGGRSASTPRSRRGRGEPAPPHVLAERGQVQPALQPGPGDERALAVDPVQQPVGDQALDRLAHGRPGHVVRRHQLALGGDRGVRPELVRRKLGQHVGELRVLGTGAVRDHAVPARSARGVKAFYLSTELAAAGTVWSGPVEPWHPSRGVSRVRGRIEGRSMGTRMAEEIAEQPEAVRRTLAALVPATRRGRRALPRPPPRAVRGAGEQ